MSDVNTLRWGNGAIEVVVEYSPTSPPSIRQLRPAGAPDYPATSFPHPQSVAQIMVDGARQENFGSRYSETLVGNDLRYVSHRISEDEMFTKLELDTVASNYGLEVTVTLIAPVGVAAVRCFTTVRNVGGSDVVLSAVTSLSTYVSLPSADIDDWDLISGRSDWLAEGRWRREALREYEMVRLLDVDSSSIEDVEISAAVTPTGATVTRSSTSSRSTADALPMGAVIDRSSNAAVVWQVEMNGPWLWQLGERVDGVYLSLSGPTDIEHHWRKNLAPGESFTTVPVAIAVSSAELAGALHELTGYRRAIVRPHFDHQELPVFFNDYMNTLMGDPSTEVLLPLIDAAADAGADCFCIDCGWYDDGGDWWPSVGQWQPSTRRFPGGLDEVLDHIRAKGMKPGIWLEPEAVGVNSATARELPDEAFVQDHGKRISTHRRFHLDIRHPEAKKHLDSVVDRLVVDHGIRFFKLDYNINADVGSSNDAESRGEGMLSMARAYQQWLEDCLERHPDLTIETCSSGAMRSDGATLSHSQLQSTSDQQDFRQYANIAATAPMMILPEQCGNWAYPSARMSLAETRFTMVNGMVGRMYLSGYLNRMEQEQRDEISRAVSVYKTIRSDLAVASPFWPLGLPAWNDSLVALGYKGPDGQGYVAVWGKRGLEAATSIEFVGTYCDFSSIEQLYGSPAQSQWDRETGILSITPNNPGEPFAALYRVSY